MDKAKKKRIKKVITWISMAAVVALLAAMPLIARQEAEADGPVASVLSAEVTKGSISSTLHGGGNILAENVEEVTLPSGVKIEGFLVKNGQFVKEGDPLAQVDKVSVMTAITEVNETLEFLREELEDARNEKVSSSIKATAGGRVKKLFAQPGESVQEVMLRDGALAILSLDGLMALKLEQALPISTGESVTVTLADGKEVTGRVESNLDNTVIITVEDEGYEVGQTVTVTDEAGNPLGQAPLYIHNAWKATAYSGTIETVNAKEEKTLSSGATIFTLKDRDYQGELRRRANQHREYEALLQELFQMYQSGYLYAPCDGEVEGVDNDSVHLLSTTPEGWVLAPLNNTAEQEEKAWTVMLLSRHDNQEQACKIGKDCPLPADSPLHQEDCIMKCDENIQCDAKNHHLTCIKLCDSDNRECKALVHYDGCISLCTGNSSCQALPQKHDGNCPQKCTNDASCKSTRPKEEHEESCIIHCLKDTDALDQTLICKAKTHYDVCVERCIGTKQCTAIHHKANCELYGIEYKALIGIVVRSASNTIEYKYDRDASAVTVTRAANGSWVLPGTPNTETMNHTGFVNSGVTCSPGTIILLVTAMKGEEVVFENQVHVYSAPSSDNGGTGMIPGMGGLGGFGGFGGFGGVAGFGGFGGMAGFGNSAVIPEADEDLFDLEGSTLLTVTAHDSAELVISIDEHDIAKISPGMKATVKVEALKGEEFAAEVTNIAVSGTNNGGSSKFAVTLKLPMSENMLSGMSASAVIALEEKQNILLIPAAALVQQGPKTVVFTALDKEGNPSDPVEVKTGLTDGENVEILSGLTEGQKIYYSYYDTVELDTSAEANKYTFR